MAQELLNASERLLGLPIHLSTGVLQMKIAGIILIVLGVLGLVYGGFRYTTRETVLDIGPIHATADREHSFPVAPIAGVLLLGAGGVMLFTSRRTA